MMPNRRDESWELGHDWEENGLLPPPKPTSLMYAVGAGSDPGKRKNRNEDSIFAARSTCNTHTSPLSFGLFVVADGLGAYANGQDASSCAIQAMIDSILPKIVESNTFEPEVSSALLAEAVQEANEAVRQRNIDLHKREGTDVDVGVGTTVTAAMVVGSTAYVANVGNCRTHLYRASEGLKKVTNDHSLVARLVEDGTLTPDDLYTHIHRNQIYRALFDQPLVEVDIFPVPLQLGDTLLLCSPGLWNMVRDPKIEDIISHAPPDPSKAVEALIQSALDGGGKDNVSVIVVTMLEAQDQTLVPGMQLFAKSESIHLSPLS